MANQGTYVEMLGNLPRGFRFQPSSEEVIEYLDEGHLIWEIFPQAVVYGEEPGKLSGTIGDDAFNGGVNYFLTKTEKINPRGTRVKRGEWESKNTMIIHKDSLGNAISWEKSFTYKSGGWTMHEYSLSSRDFVVCKITRTKRSDSSAKETNEAARTSIAAHQPNEEYSADQGDIYGQLMAPDICIMDQMSADWVPGCNYNMVED